LIFDEISFKGVKGEPGIPMTGPRGLEGPPGEKGEKGNYKLLKFFIIKLFYFSTKPKITRN